MASSDGSERVADPRGSVLPILPIIRSAFRVFALAPGKFLGLLILPVLFGLVPSLLATMVRSEPYYPAAKAGATVIQYALEFMANGAIIVGVAAVLSDKAFDFETALGIGFRRSIPNLAVTILVGSAVFVGTLAFVVPGVILAVMLCVAIPATVLEGLGPVDSLKRSAALTRGHRWRLFAIALVAVVPAPSVVAAAMALVPAHHTGAAVSLFVIALVMVVILAAILPSVVFLRLREAGPAGPPAKPIRLPGGVA